MSPGIIALAAAMLVALLLLKFYVVRTYAWRYALAGRRLTIACAVYNAPMLPLLLFPFFVAGTPRGWTTVWLLGSPILWAVEAGIYYYLSRVPVRHAVGVSLVANIAQNVALSLLIWGQGIAVS